MENLTLNRLGLCLLLVGAFVARNAAARPVSPQLPPSSVTGRIEQIEKSPLDGRFRLATNSDTGHYYQLYRSVSPSRLGMVTDMRLGTGNQLWLKDNLTIQKEAFFRLQEIPLDASLDTDGDGLSDAFELQPGTEMNPFNPGRVVSYADGAVRLPDETSFDGVSHLDNFPGAPNVKEVKFLIYGVDTAKPELYFLNVARHPYHYYFARNVLKYHPELNDNAGLTQFNGETYWAGVGKRKNLAGSLVMHENWQPKTGGKPGLLTMEFWPSDPVPYYFVQMAYDLITRSIPWLEVPIAYFATSEPQRALYKQERALFQEAEKSKLRTISTQDLFGENSYTMLNPGVGFGQLTIFDGSTRVSAKDVVIFRNIPNEITRLAGIITELPQTPLSHINLKAKQNDTPNAFVKNAANHPDIAPLIGKFVRFETLATGFTMREATAAEVDTYLAAIRPTTPQVPVRNLLRRTITPLSGILFTDSRAYGAKVTNVAELRKIPFSPGVTVPDGFGIPFYFYDEFMKFNGLYTHVTSLLADQDFMSDPETRGQALALLRKRINASSFPPSLQTAITNLQNSFPADVQIRCRSSTNNEDLVGYSGAGLYESYTHRPDEGNLSKTIKQVYAALWLQRAFEEREFYRVDHLATAMGVLVHRSLDGELANGVGVTKNLVDPNWTGYYVNAQLGENLVTNPGANDVPEEFLIARLLGDTKYTIQYVTFSNLVSEDQKVLSAAQAELLADQMAKIHSYFYPKYGFPAGFAMELEWKIEASGYLQIKQARPWID